MSKKSLIAMISIAAVIVAGIVVAITQLYRKEAEPENASNFQDRHPLVTSVPSDAAIVFCVKDFGRLQEYVRDSSAAFGELFSGRLDRLLSKEYHSLRKLPAIVSVNYSKDMPALLIIEAEKALADTANADILTLKEKARESGLNFRSDNGRVLISPSETIINSSIRHYSSGHSVLEADGFAPLAATLKGEDILFLSNAYSDKIIEAFFARKHQRKSSFFKEISKWTAFTIERHSEKGVEAKGNLLYGMDPSYYMNVLQHVSDSPSTVAEVLPAHADYFYSLPIGSFVSYSKAYRNYLDAKSRLDKFETTLKNQGKTFGKNAEKWAEDLNIKEIAVAGVRINDKIRDLILIKPGSKSSLFEGIAEYPYAGFAETMFGGIFKASEENSWCSRNGWLIVGDSVAVAQYAKPSFYDQNLAAFMKDSGLDGRIPRKNCGFFFYHSMGESPALIDESLGKRTAGSVRNILKGVTYVPLTLSVTRDEADMRLSLAIDRIIVSKSKAPTVDRDTTVAVPSGPYKVKNCATGKDNTLYQNSHKSICLRDENGKDVWGIPFKEDIRGYVETIDYYGNGKLQFLFAAGSKLYLLDRLGRFVGGFPVDLGKKIVVGPKVYDFTGAHGYRAMTLNVGNTVGFYNLHGQAVEGWKGIKVNETIKSLPELVSNGNSKYWLVRTSRQTLVFPFMGGESLISGEGEKMIRPDSEITFKENGAVTGKCYDGKERTFKLKR